MEALALAIAAQVSVGLKDPENAEAALRAIAALLLNTAALAPARDDLQALLDGAEYEEPGVEPAA